ncbi:MAG: HEAT repeat domain-containing protein [Planctomycetes bacterium]|nr:HEAT repeat domain-containing protein [Planctomycetota bacterium]
MNARIPLPALLIALALFAPAAADTDEDLVARLGAEAWKDREAAMKACLDRPSARSLLEAAASGSDPEVRWRAKWALDGLDWGVDAALAHEVGNPFDQWKDMPPAELGGAIQRVMGCQKPARAGVLLRALRRVTDESVRAGAMAGLRQRAEGFTEWAKEKLASEDPETRTGAALALALWGDKTGVDVLKKDLETGQPLFGRQETIEALIGLGESAGLAAVLAAIRDAVKSKKLPSPREIEVIAGAPVGTAEVEAILLELLEADWGEGVDPAETNDKALEALARCAGPGAVPRLAAWWEKDPSARSDAISVAVAISDEPGREALATRVATALGGEKATPDDLFMVAALQRIAGRKEEHRKAVDRLAGAEGVPTGFERIAETALTLLEAGDGKAAEAYLQKAMEKAGGDIGPLQLVWREAMNAAGKDGDSLDVDRDYNNEAWGLVTHPEKLAHPGLAVRLADWSTKNAPGVLALRGTQGAAYFRAGRFDESAKTLEQNLEPFYEGKQEDLAFLAMAYKRLGREEDARRIDAKCREWETADGKPNPMRPELERVMRESQQAK